MADPRPAERKSLWKVVLIVSLALNLLVAGFVVGTLVSGRLGDGAPRNFELGVSPVARALTASERRAVGRDLRRARVLRDLAPREHAADVVAVLQAQTFDPQALRAAFAAQGAELLDVQDRASDALVEVIARMTPERRAAFAADIAAWIARGRDGFQPSSGG